MSKTPEQYEKEILAVIAKDEDICFITEIFIDFSGCSRSTFYELGLDKSDKIESALEKNRTVAKKDMRTNWRKPDAAPNLQKNAFQLMGTDEERKRLSTGYVEQTVDLKADVSTGIKWIGEDG